MNKTNIYIGSLPRSGSTLLGMMIDQHSKCFHIGESHYWKKYNVEKTRCSCGKLKCDILANVYKKIKNKKNVFAIHEVCNILDDFPYKTKNISSDTTNLLFKQSYLGLNDLCKIFRNITKKNIIVDKSTNIRLARYLAKKDDWKIILLTRDPRGMTYSRKKAAKRHNQKLPKDLYLSAFIDFAKVALSVLDSANVLHVKYEDICNNTETVLKKISKFLSIKFESDMINFKKSHGHTIMGNRMRFNKKNKIIQDFGWIRGLNNKELSSIVENFELTKLYKKLGYNIK